MYRKIETERQMNSKAERPRELDQQNLKQRDISTKNKKKDRERDRQKRQTQTKNKAITFKRVKYVQTDRQTHMRENLDQIDRQKDRQTDRKIDRQKDRQTERQIDRKIDRQKDRQTHLRENLDKVKPSFSIFFATIFSF